MHINIKKPFAGIFAFLLVLLTMPLGHAAVIAMESAFGEAYKFHAAALSGFVGLAILFAGIVSKREITATLLGLFGGLFVWAGWIEFAFIYYANRIGVAPLVINGEIVTKPEYLLMPSTIGIWAVFMIYYFVGVKSGCRFFSWFQDRLKINRLLDLPKQPRNIALVTFMELILLVWTFYLVLLFAYDSNFAGDKHPVTFIVAMGTLLWSLILFVKLIRIDKPGYAVRYAIPTVVIFWTFIEILGRWNMFEEIWINPGNHWPEIAGMTIVLFVLTLFIIFSKAENKKKR